MKTLLSIGLSAVLLTPGLSLRADEETAPPGITHALLVTGSRTAILEPTSAPPGMAVVWSYPESTRDGWVLPGGTIVLAVSKGKRYPGGAVVELSRSNEVKFEWKGTQEEVNSVQKLPGGGYVVTEAGPRPRLLELDARGGIVLEFPLECQKENAHMQTRMARKLPGGTYLVPHLLDFAVKEYSSGGKVLRVLETAVDPARAQHTWPFTAIRLANGNTVVGCTHGNRVVELDRDGKVVWQLSNEDLKPAGLELKDACGVQRLPNGNTVITSYAAGPGEARLIEVTREKKVAWIYRDSEPHGIHHFQILTTNGKPLEGEPLK